jgi:hypothetical protein
MKVGMIRLRRVRTKRSKVNLFSWPAGWQSRVGADAARLDSNYASYGPKERGGSIYTGQTPTVTSAVQEALSTKKGRLASAFAVSERFRLLEVLADQAGHFEHRNLRLAEDFLQFGVGVDHAFVDRVLQLVFLDVSPQLADHFGTRQRG